MTNKSLNYDKYKGHTGPWKQSLIGQIADATDLVAVVNMHACNPANEALIADSPLILQRCMELEKQNAVKEKIIECERSLTGTFCPDCRDKWKYEGCPRCNTQRLEKRCMELERLLETEKEVSADLRLIADELGEENQNLAKALADLNQALSKQREGE